MTHRHTIASIVLGAIAAYASAATPSWLEADSAAAIESRIRSDFSLTYKEGSWEIKRRHPGVTDADIRDFARRGYVEVRRIEGQERMHAKSPRNLGLVNPSMNGGYVGRTSPATAARIAYVDSVLDGTGSARRIRYRYSVDVPYHESLAGDTLRLWLPVPRPSP